MKTRMMIMAGRYDREPLELFLAAQSLVWGLVFLSLPPGGLITPFIWVYCSLYVLHGAVGLWALSRWQWSLRRSAFLMGTCLWAFSAFAVLTMARGQVLAPYYILLACTCAWSFVRMGARRAAT